MSYVTRTRPSTRHYPSREYSSSYPSREYSSSSMHATPSHPVYETRETDDEVTHIITTEKEPEREYERVVETELYPTSWGRRVIRDEEREISSHHRPSVVVYDQSDNYSSYSEPRSRVHTRVAYSPRNRSPTRVVIPRSKSPTRVVSSRYY